MLHGVLDDCQNYKYIPLLLNKTSLYCEFGLTFSTRDGTGHTRPVLTLALVSVKV